MKPVSPVIKGIPEHVFGKDQPQYQSLPAILCTDDGGTVITRWKLSLKERIKVLLKGSIYLQQLTFGDNLQPQLPSVQAPQLELVPTDEAVEAGGTVSGSVKKAAKKGRKQKRVIMYVDNDGGIVQ